MGIVEIPEYDHAMTYIVGMITNEGILLASDTLANRIRVATGQMLTPDLKAQKIFSTSDNSIAAFAGAFGSLPTHVSVLASALEFRPQQFRNTAQFIGQATARAFNDVLIRNNRDLEILIGGFDKDEMGHSIGEPKLYLYRRFVTSDGGEGLYPVDGVRDAGFRDSVAAKLEADYKVSSKDYETLRLIVIKAVSQAAKDVPKEVGGEISIYHLTPTGVRHETVPIC